MPIEKITVSSAVCEKCPHASYCVTYAVGNGDGGRYTCVKKIYERSEAFVQFRLSNMSFETKLWYLNVGDMVKSHLTNPDDEVIISASGTQFALKKVSIPTEAEIKNKIS